MAEKNKKGIYSVDVNLKNNKTATQIKVLVVENGLGRQVSTSVKRAYGVDDIRDYKYSSTGYVNREKEVEIWWGCVL